MEKVDHNIDQDMANIYFENFQIGRELWMLRWSKFQPKNMLVHNADYRWPC